MRSLRINGLGLLEVVGEREREKGKEVEEIRELRNRRWRERRLNMGERLN